MAKWEDPTKDLSDEERDRLTHEILWAELNLGNLITGVRDHLLQTKAMCPTSCIGEQVGMYIEALDDDERHLLLVHALRKLAATEWEKAQ